MTEFFSRKRTTTLACVLGLSLGPVAPVLADAAHAQDPTGPKEDLNEAGAILEQMRDDPELWGVVGDAPAVFIVPDYARAALGVGVRGGEGVLLTNEDGEWTNPVFYDFGGISGGLEAGAEAGAIAMVLTSERAVDTFMQENNWSLNADAGLTIVNWSEKAQASVGKGDVIVWSDTEGLLGDLSVSVTDINFDEEETAQFYGKEDVTRANIRDGEVAAPDDVLADVNE